MRLRFLKSALQSATVDSNQKVTQIVQGVIQDIRQNGDKAVRTYSEKFDKWSPQSFRLTDAEVQACIAKVPSQTIKDIKAAQENVRKFAEAQRATIHDLEVEILLETLSTAEVASQAWKDYGEIVLAKDMDEAYSIADEYCSEHVQILTHNPKEALGKMTNYGALFLGEKTTVSYGDKCIGTNHVLPTRKAGNYTGGLWVGKFLRTQTYQQIIDTKTSGEMGELCGRCSRAENFEGHARSGDLRAHKYLGVEYSWIREAEERLRSSR